MSDLSHYMVNDLGTPVMAFALHAGHAIAPRLRTYMLLSEAERAHEEDPYTGDMIFGLPVTTVRVRQSRFQLDLNRTREKSVYLHPDDAWGLRVWKPLPEEHLRALYEAYDQFYERLKQLITDSIRQWGFFIILDVHSYNHRREGPFTPAAPDSHPEINIGTAYNHSRWQSLCDDYTAFLTGAADWLRPINIGQNIIFKGGAFAQWILENYGDQGAVLSIEFKKTFMDEWTGILDIDQFNRIKKLLSSGVVFLNNQYRTVT
ncbi:N-formylglutamate amidohydrolase [Niabella terrae]